MRNWRYFNWLWTGSQAGLQIHHDDISNWLKNDYPIKTHGIGGRAALKGPEHGDIYDHFYNEYEYADGFKLHSEIRHISGTVGKRGITFIGTKGKADFADGISTHKGQVIWKKDPKVVHNPYQIEQDAFIKSIQTRKPINDTEWGAKSTLTTIMGRMAAHSGLEIKWEEAMQSDIVLAPAHLTWNSPAPCQPDASGNYPVPLPGVSKV
jgi:predicted dehydrogenase